MTMVRNAAGRLVPDEIPGIGSVRPFEGVTGVAPSPAFNTIMEVKRDVVPMGTNKIAPDLRTAIERSGLCDGMTIASIITSAMVIEWLLRFLKSLTAWALKTSYDEFCSVGMP